MGCEVGELPMRTTQISQAVLPTVMLILRKCQRFCPHYTTEHTKQHLKAWARRSARPLIRFINSRIKTPPSSRIGRKTVSPVSCRVRGRRRKFSTHEITVWWMSSPGVGWVRSLHGLKRLPEAPDKMLTSYLNLTTTRNSALIAAGSCFEINLNDLIYSNSKNTPRPDT